MKPIKFFSHHAINMGPRDLARPIAAFVRPSRTADGVAQRFVERIRGILRLLKALCIRPASSMQARHAEVDKLFKAYNAIDLESDGQTLQASLETAFKEHGTVSNFLRQLSSTSVTQAGFAKIRQWLSEPILEGRDDSTFNHLMALDSTARADLLSAIQQLDEKEAQCLNVKIMDLASDIYEAIKADVLVAGGQSTMAAGLRRSLN